MPLEEEDIFDEKVYPLINNQLKKDLQFILKKKDNQVLDLQEDMVKAMMVLKEKNEEI